MKKVAVLILIVFLSLAAKVSAQQVSLSITPPLLEMVIKPGKALLIAYRVENYADPSVLRSKVVSFVPTDQFGNINVKEELNGPVRFSLDNADLQLDQPFLLRTRESKQLLLRMRVPEGAPEGDYYYTLIAETDPSPFQEGTTASRAQARIGANIIITVSNTGRVDIKGRVSVLDTLSRLKFKFFGREYRIFDSADKIPIVMIVENTGKNAIKPEGEIKLKGPFGGKSSYNILPQNILAQSQRQLSATPSAELNCDREAVGNRVPFYCKGPSTVVLSGFFIGKYDISSSVSFGEGSRSIFAQTSFLALPLKFGFALLGIIFITIFILRKSNKKDES